MRRLPVARLPVPRLLVLALALWSLAGCARVGGEAFQPTVTTALTLTEDRPVGQTIRPAGDILRGIDVLVATYGTSADPAGTLQVEVLDDAGVTLSSAQVAGSALHDNDWVTLRFAEPVGVPTQVALHLTWTGQSQVGLYANTPATPHPDGVLLNDPYPGGELLIDGVPAPGDLAFRVRGDGGIGTAVNAVGRLIRDAAGRLNDVPGFALLWVVLMGGATTLAARGFRRSRTVVQLGQSGPDDQQREDHEARPQQAHNPIRHA